MRLEISTIYFYQRYQYSDPLGPNTSYQKKITVRRILRIKQLPVELIVSVPILYLVKVSNRLVVYGTKTFHKNSNYNESFVNSL